MELNDYILPVLRRAGDDRSFAGTAFCIEGHLLTAGHVLQSPATYYVRRGSDCLALDFSRWTPRQMIADDKLGYDVAIYPSALPSPLTLSDSDARKHDELELLCWQFIAGRPQQVATQCVVRGDADEDGYQLISTTIRITHGASGCPVFKNGKVYGMLCMGRDDYQYSGAFAGISPQHHQLMHRIENNTCWIFKSSHIKRFMPEALTEAGNI